jgi:hypothetical protein
MDWVKFCQWYLLVAFAVKFLVMVWFDFNGRPALKPAGFPGFIGTLINIGLGYLILYTAGAFSVIFGSSP